MPKEDLLMSDDDRGFIDRTKSITEKLYGRPMTAADIADSFALCRLTKRAETLEDLDAELRGEIDSSPEGLRRRVELMALRKHMGGVHAALRKAGR
jgi:hypothetical protein